MDRALSGHGRSGVARAVVLRRTAVKAQVEPAWSETESARVRRGAAAARSMFNALS